MTSGFNTFGYYVTLAETPPLWQPREVLELLAWELHVVAMALAERARDHERADPEGRDTVVTDLRHLADLIAHRADGYRYRARPDLDDEHRTVPQLAVDPDLCTPEDHDESHRQPYRPSRRHVRAGHTP